MKTHLRSASTSNVMHDSGKINRLFDSPSRKRAMQIYLQQFIHPQPAINNKSTSRKQKRNMSVQLSYLPYFRWDKPTLKTPNKISGNFRLKMFSNPIKISHSYNKIPTPTVKDQQPDDQITAKIIQRQIFSFDTRDQQFFKQLITPSYKQMNKQFKQFRKNRFQDKTNKKIN